MALVCIGTSSRQYGRACNDAATFYHPRLRVVFVRSSVPFLLSLLESLGFKRHLIDLIVALDAQHRVPDAEPQEATDLLTTDRRELLEVFCL